MASGRERLCARCDDRERAPDVPDIVQHDRVARHVQRGEGFEFAGHGGAPRTVARPTQMPATLSQNCNPTVTEHSPNCRYGARRDRSPKGLSHSPVNKMLIALPLAALLVGLRSQFRRTAAARAASIKIVGSSTVYPFTKAVAEEFMRANPGINVTSSNRPARARA